jgi:hypothetical protein
MLSKMKYWIGALMLSALVFTACDDEEGEAPALTIEALTATGIDIETGEETTVDLNAATSPSDVPPNSTFTVTFSKSLDATTLSGSAFALANEAGESISLTANATGSEATVTINEDMTQGLIYTLTIDGTIAAEDGGALTSSTRTFTVAGRAPADVPQEDNLVVYVDFEGEVREAFGKNILNSEVTFGEDRFGNFNGAADFNGVDNYIGIEYSADMSNASTTVSYWMRLPEQAEFEAHFGTTAEGTITQFVTFGIGGNNGTYHEWNRFTCCDLGFDIDILKYVTNHENSGSASELAADFSEMKNEGNPNDIKVVEADNVDWLRESVGNWVHVVTSWDAGGRRKAFYINGVPLTVFEFVAGDEYALDAATIDVDGINLDPANNPNLYLGTAVPFWATIEGDGVVPFRGGREYGFKGQMDDFRMFSVALTDAEVLELYNAERP